LTLPEIPDPAQNPLSFACICKHQQQDEQLLALQVESPDQYIYKSLDKDVDDIICYVHQGDNPDKQWRIVLPQQMLEETVKWFHQVMGHTDEKRLRETLQQCYHHPKLRYTINRFQYEHCQRHKLSGKGYGLLPEGEMQTAPWEEVAINLIGPWKVKVNNKKVEFNVLMCIDTASNLVESIRIDNKTHVTYETNSSRVGCLAIPNPFVAYTIRTANSSEAHFNGSSTVLTSRMFSRHPRIRNRTQFANVCTKQWATY
jgi:hypothetical protein